MIVTVTLNPAVDKTYTTGSLMLGQVNRMRTVMNIAGGKGVNVAKILRQYGYPVMVSGFLGGFSGDFIQESMKRVHADCRFTRIQGETRSSINIIAEDGYVTEILEPGPLITGIELEAFLESYERNLGECDWIVMSGSVPKGVPADVYRHMIELASARNKRVILDTSGEALRHGIEAAPYMVKPNQKELEYLVGHKLRDMGELAEAAKLLLEKGVQHVLVSMGKRGMLSVTEKEVLFARCPNVKAVNTVGCGDSVVASYAMSYERGEEPVTALKLAAAISAANAATLESGDISQELAEDLLEKIQIEKKEP